MENRNRSQFTGSAGSGSSNDELLIRLKKMVVNERELLLKILHSLREVESRKLHLEMGFPDLYSFMTKELGYSSGAAYRRISAMRLMKSVPEAAARLASGELQLENASQAQSSFRKEDLRRKAAGQEALTVAEKRRIVEDLSGKSTRDGLRLLTELLPEVNAPTEKLRPLPEQKTLVQFIAAPTLMEKLEELKCLLAHKNYEGRMDVLIENLADIALRKLKREPDFSQPPAKKVMPSPAPEMQTAAPRAEMEAKAAPPPEKRSRYIPANERRVVLQRDREGCTYRDPRTGRVCGARHGLQFDHLRPFSQGGPHTAGNLTLRCGPHNRFRAEQAGLARARRSYETRSR